MQPLRPSGNFSGNNFFYSYGFKIIEDASHAIGGSYKGKKVGSCRYSDITVFSFHPVKIITTGEGGMALTNSVELLKRMALLRSHGVTRYPSEMTSPPDGAWYYQQIELGFNYRMTEIQAALGITQMQRINEFVLERNRLANVYDELLNIKGFITPWRHPDVYSSHHLYIIQIEDEDIFSKRKEVIMKEIFAEK